MHLFAHSLSATTGAIDWDIFNGADFSLARADLVFATAPTSAGLITVTKKSVFGAAYDTVVDVINPVGLLTVRIAPLGGLVNGDKVNVSYANSDGVSITGTASVDVANPSILGGAPSMSSAMCLQRIGEGRYPGYSVVEKFGENSEITTATDPADIWDYGGIYTWSTTADIDRLSSSDNSDTQNILVFGLDSNWMAVSQVVTLTGQTPVALSTSLIRVYRMINIGTTDLAGNAYCFVNGSTTGGVPDTPADVRAMIRNGNNQTLMCIYTVPADKTGYLYNGYVTISRGVAAAAAGDFTARARPYGSVFQVKISASCISTGSSAWERNFPVPLELPPKTDILIRCEEVSATIGVSGGFTIVLRDTPQTIDIG